MYSGSTKQTKWPFEVALKTESVFCRTAPWDSFGDIQTQFPVQPRNNQ